MAKRKKQVPVATGKDTPITEEDIPKTVRIPHHRSPHFTSHHATGTIMSGPSSDGSYHLIFHADSIGIEYETGVYDGQFEKAEGEEYIASAKFTTKIDPEAIETFREDKVRVSLPYKSLIRLRNLLNGQFLQEDSAEDKGNPDEPA